jgi:hypothetical protein
LIISGSRAEVGSSKHADRVHRQGPGDRHALLLAAGELAGEPGGVGLEADPVEQA